MNISISGRRLPLNRKLECFLKKKGSQLPQIMILEKNQIYKVMKFSQMQKFSYAFNKHFNNPRRNTTCLRPRLSHTVFLLPENCFLDASGTEQHLGTSTNQSINLSVSLSLSCTFFFSQRLKFHQFQMPPVNSR